MAEDEKLIAAKERVKQLKAFYGHLLAYITVMAVLFFIDYSDGGNWWFYWPAVIWGIFVASQGLGLTLFGKGWEDKKIKEIMEKEE
jgi:hypothetical protein